MKTEKSDLDRIFEIFRRLHTRREFADTGIGLVICKKIVERHGGQIWAESEPGVGTMFYFNLEEEKGQMYSFFSPVYKSDDTEHSC